MGVLVDPGEATVGEDDLAVDDDGVHAGAVSA
jgi:hypothetical protein